MRRLALILCLTGVAYAQEAPPAGPCDGGETLFTCPVKGGKELKVCGGAGDRPWITYLYGKPGAPELVFPKARDGVSAFKYEARTYAQSMGDVMSFVNGDVTYEVTEMIGAGGPDGESNNYAGVYVTQGPKVLAKVACTSPPTSNWARIKELLGAE